MRLLKWITTLMFAFALVCLGNAPAVAQQDLDSVKADPAHHKVVFENDQVRVVRYMLAPGDKTPKHTHPDNVNISLTDANVKITAPDGKSTEVHGKTGAVAWRGATTHIAENIGDKPVEGILVEPKKPASAVPAGALDEIAADPKHKYSKVEFENEQVRVIRYHFELGDKSNPHGHPDNVQVLLTDYQSNVTTPDGKTTPGGGKAGEARWRLAGQHVVQNTGGKPFEGIIVEMKGAPGAKAGGN
jgi:quercetin dioxygenase-like cupin family protein